MKTPKKVCLTLMLSATISLFILSFFIDFSYVFDSGGKEKTTPDLPYSYEPATVFDYQPENTFVIEKAPEEIQELKAIGISAGKTTVKRTLVSNEKKSQTTFGALVIPYKAIPKGTPVKLTMVEYNHNEYRWSIGTAYFVLVQEVKK